MIQTSDAYKAYCKNTSVIAFEIRFNIHGENTTYSIFPEDCKDGTFRLTDELCPVGELTVGNTVSTWFEVELIEGLDSSLDLEFEDVKLFFGVPDENGHPSQATIFQRGVYAVERKFIFGRQTKLTGYDHFADAYYNSANINGFDCGNYSTWQDLMVGLGYDMGYILFPTGQTGLGTVSPPSIKVSAEWGLENKTRRDMAGYVAEAWGSNLKYDNEGRLKRVDLPNVTTYRGRALWLVGSAVVGGLPGAEVGVESNFIIKADKILEEPQIYGEPTSCDHIAIKAVDGTLKEDSFIYIDPEYTTGSYSYLCSRNPFIRDEAMADVAMEQWEEKLVGAFYTPFSMSVIGNPCWESGDTICFHDSRDHIIYSVITSFQYNQGGVSTISCHVDEVRDYDTISQMLAEEGSDTVVIENGETVTSMDFMGFGHVTYQSKRLEFLIPFSKYITATGFTVTSITGCSIRTADAKWLNYNDGSSRTAMNNITLLYDSITTEILPSQGLKITAVCDEAWYDGASSQISTNTLVGVVGTLTGQFTN